MRSPDRRSLLAALLGLAAGLALAVPAAVGETRAIDLEGTWFVLVHYRDESTANPEATRWLDLVWTFARKGTRLEWTEYPLVVFESTIGRFEAIPGNRRSRVLAGWEPNEQQWKTISQGPRVNQRGSKTKTLRGSDTQGWRSSRRMVQTSAMVVGYQENLTIEGLTGKPVFLREDILGNVHRKSGEGSTRYQVSEVLDDGRMLRGTYERDGIKHGSFRLWKTAPVRGLIEKKGTPNERRHQATKKAIEEAQKAVAEDVLRRAAEGDPEAIRQLKDYRRRQLDRRDR